jgi:hypothetical protein
LTAKGEIKMALLTVEGIYRDGKVELTEALPYAPAHARVLVTFLPANGAQAQAVTTTPDDAATREALRQQAFARMEKGIPLGGPPYPKREELYDRFKR